MSQVAGWVRSDLAQYRELASSLQYGAEVDAALRATMERGARLMELIKQDQCAPLEPQDQIALFFAATQGLLNSVPVEAIAQCEALFVRYLQQEAQGIRNALLFEQRLTPEIEQGLRLALQGFMETIWQQRG